METYGDKSKKASMERKEYLKKSLKAVGVGMKKVADYVVPPKTAEQIEYEKKLKKQTQEEYRKQYLKSAISETKKKAKMAAKAKYDPEMKKKSIKSNEDAMDMIMKL